MTELERSVTRYLRHVDAVRSGPCPCPEDSWAPCGAQYEGRYSEDCAQHRVRVSPGSHYPSGCSRALTVC